MDFISLKLTVTFKLNWHSREQTAVMRVYNGRQLLSTVEKTFELDPSPQEVKKYIDSYCLDRYQAMSIWCRYMRGEEYDSESVESYTDFLLSHIDYLERKLDRYKSLDTKNDEDPWPSLYGDDGLPF